MALETVNINSGWHFRLGIETGSEKNNFDDSGWRLLGVPHDWSIEEKFFPDAPGYCRAAYLPNGKGTYRKSFRVPEQYKDCKTVLYFGGVYKNAEVFINGKKVGGRPWGYIPFEFDITDELNKENENIICVTVDNSRMPGTRWYSGTGIYRDVVLKFFSKVHFPTWGIYVNTVAVSGKKTSVNVRYHIVNTLPVRMKCETVHRILNAENKVVASSEKTHVIGAGLEIFLDDVIPISAPVLWDIENPVLYTLESEIHYDNGLVDCVKTKFGIRNMVCDSDKGFFLNGKPVKIKGVCLHNDGGALGAACVKKTFIRQLQILKTMGCNAVRTAHHPFSEDFLDACDELGILVLAEAFDEWQEPIRVVPYSDGEPQSLFVNYYAELFDEWSKKDLTDMILRDRNHPSVFMWSIGNEIPQMYKPSGFYIAEKLVEIIANLDNRPITCAAICGRLSPKNINLLSVAGFNYPQAEILDEFRKLYPWQPIIITEDHSAQTRRPMGKCYPAGILPDMGYSHQGTADSIKAHEDMQPGITAWEKTAERPFIMGEFIWTGFDYLGEPTPYDYPAHTSFFGVIDICGVPKDGYFYYRSVWKADPLVHIASTWDFKPGEEIEIRVISNCGKVELFINDVSFGNHSSKNSLFHWRIPFMPGKLSAVGYTEDGKSISDQVHTSGTPACIKLTPYSENSIEKGTIEYIICEIFDSQRLPVKNSTALMTFDVAGEGRLLAVDNGNQMSLDPFQNNNKVHFCNGKCLCIIKAGDRHGKIKIRAFSDELNLETEIIKEVR